MCRDARRLFCTHHVGRIYGAPELELAGHDVQEAISGSVAQHPCDWCCRCPFGNWVDVLLCPLHRSSSAKAASARLSLASASTVRTSCLALQTPAPAPLASRASGGLLYPRPSNAQRRARKARPRPRKPCAPRERAGFNLGRPSDRPGIKTLYPCSEPPTIFAQFFSIARSDPLSCSSTIAMHVARTAVEAAS